MSEYIFVTKPYLPPLEEMIPYLENIWHKRVLTNGGDYHHQLEEALCQYLEVPYISLFTNGTIALITALQALDLSGEVITTPFSFVATSHCLKWRNLTPVFADIDPHTLNLSAKKVEAAITDKTSAILPVHCYGRPCDIKGLSDIARRFDLKIVYDAAHAFGVRLNGESILNHGDLAVLSFHATKVFNIFEGGAIICSNPEMKKRIDDLKNFGIESETDVRIAGLNGKMNEFSAALGLLQLQYIERTIKYRRSIDEEYRSLLEDIEGITCLDWASNVESNYSYFPILVENNYPLTRDQLNNYLRTNYIIPRRYFYPLISEFPMYNSLPSSAPENLPIANDRANKILCLPIFPELELLQVKKIVSLIKKKANIQPLTRRI